MFYNLLISEGMNILRNVISIATLVVMAIAGLAAIILVLLQPGNSTGIDALGGSSETFFGKNKTRSLDAKLQKMTVICAVCFFVLTAVLAIFA